MSPHAVNSFVTDLVAMAQAMERVPVLEQELEQARGQAIGLASRITELELSLEAKTIYAAGLEQKVHDAEVARDDAEMRFLELDEKAINILAMAKAARASLDQMTGLLDPPKPEPVAEPTTIINEALAHVEGQSEPLPIEALTPLTSTGSSTSDTIPLENADSSGWNHDIQPVPSPEVTQSQADPIGEVSASTTAIEPSPNALPTHGNSTDGEVAPKSENAISASPEPGPYSGKFYYDEPRFIPLELWIVGGGTEYGYNWRPEAKRSPLY